MARKHGLQHRNAEFGRLLGDVVDTRPLDRREAEPNIRVGRLGARLITDLGHGRLLAAGRECRLPFAVAAVEQQQRGAVGTPHDVAQIVDLRLAERRLDPGGEVCFDEKARYAHRVPSWIIALHGCMMPP